MRMNQKSINFS